MTTDFQEFPLRFLPIVDKHIHACYNEYMNQYMNQETQILLNALKSGLILMIISVISCRPGLYQYFKRLARRNTYLAAVINAILFFLCIAYMIYSSYTPFMYQQF